MTRNLRAFLAANAISPVVDGAVIGQGGEGARYVLADGKSFTLTAAECAEIVDGPRWDLGQ